MTDTHTPRHQNLDQPAATGGQDRTPRRRRPAPWWPPGPDRRAWALLAAVAVACLGPAAQAVQIQDLVRLKGAETSKLVGMGLVVGLGGTGDGGKYLPAIRALANITGSFFDDNTIPSDVKDTKNVAVVYLEATIPGPGVREGDRIDVHVSAVGNAKSLKGGRLVHTPLTGPLPNSPVYAFAFGPLTIEDDQTPSVGLIKNGGQTVEDIRTQLLDAKGRITLVIHKQVASWPVAHNIASLINDIMAPDGPPVCRADDQKNVVIHVPEARRQDPSGFISQILRTYIDQDLINTGARVLINERTGQILLGAQVEIAPVFITAPGITITTIAPQPPATEQNPSHFLPIDPANRGGAKLGQLVRALERLQVPASNRIAIISNLHRMGALHAELIIE